MDMTKNLLAGLGGAVALSALHESLKNVSDNMPRVDIVGKEALQKSLNYAGTGISDPDKMYTAALAADLLSNSLYYSLIGMAGKKNVWPAAVLLGLAGGAGAVALPKPLGLASDPVARTSQVKILTVAYYLAGALATGFILKSLSSE